LATFIPEMVNEPYYWSCLTKYRLNDKNSEIIFRIRVPNTFALTIYEQTT